MRITNNLTIITTTLAMSALSLVSTQTLTAATAADTSTVQTLVSNETVSASDTVKLNFARPTVTTSPAAIPAVAKAVPVAAKAAPAPAAVAAPQTPQKTVAPASNAPVAPAAKSAPAAPVAAPSSGRGGVIAAAALAQLGVMQDCTRLATKSLAAAGISFHGWPAGYLSLGSTVSAAQAQPGDLIYYPNGGMGLAHIAVYIGGGKAVHGGWNGGTTAIASAFVGSGATFIRV